MYVDKVYNMLTMAMSFFATNLQSLLYYYNNKLADDVGAKVILPVLFSQHFCMYF